MQNFSQRLAHAIQRSQKKKGELAEHCGVALSTVSRWLDGMVPKNDMLDKVAAFLNVEAQWLLFGGNDFAQDAKLNDDTMPYRSRLSGPLRNEGEPTMTERISRLEQLHAEARDGMRDLNEKLDALIDLLKGENR